MKMVAASKLRRAQNQILAARPYALRMDDVLQNLVKKTDLESHPLLSFREPRRVELLVLTSNRGLCGGFNSNILRAADRFIAEHQNQYESIRVSTIGRKGKEYFDRKAQDIAAYYEGASANPSVSEATSIAEDLASRFKSGQTDAVYLLYNEFKSAISQNVRLYELHPIRPLDDWDSSRTKVGELASVSGDRRAVAGQKADLAAMEGADAEWTTSPAIDVESDGFEHVFEPDRDSILDALLPQHLAIQIYRALLESTAAEHGARMSAMDAASRNAKDVIERLTISMNRARQASITTELVEIVSGAQALEN